MAITIFVVRATITKDKEAAFNRWYNEEHVPQLLQYNGAVSARRYRKILGDDKYGDFELNHALAKQGVKRLLLHARRLAFLHPVTRVVLRLEAPLPPDMRKFAEARLALQPDRL